MEIDYFLSLRSPYTYLGHGRFEALAEKYGAAVRYRLMDTGRVLAAAGTQPLGERPPARRAYRLMELRRWRKLLDMPLNLAPRHFPVPDQPAARMVLAALEMGTRPGPLIGALLRAVWVEERDLADPDTLAAIAGETGLDGVELARRGQDGTVTAQLEINSEYAIGHQVFGVPTWKIGEELYWGQDRLEFIERALRNGA